MAVAATVALVAGCGGSGNGSSATSTQRTASALPTLSVALTGSTGVSVSGNAESGAVSITSTFQGKPAPGAEGGPSFGLVRLNPGATIQQAEKAVASAHEDINALNPYGSLVVDASAPGTVQAVLAPGKYAALNLNTAEHEQPAYKEFTVTKSSAPAALPEAQDTQSAIDFAFRGPSVLKNGTMVRTVNQGYLVHMLVMIGVRDAAAGHKVVELLRAGKDKEAQHFASGSFVGLLGPVSTGAAQQQVLHAKPGYYVEACFMDTQDGREHTALGMLRLVRVE